MVKVGCALQAENQVGFTRLDGLYLNVKGYRLKGDCFHFYGMEGVKREKEIKISKCTFLRISAAIFNFNLHEKKNIFFYLQDLIQFYEYLIFYIFFLLSILLGMSTKTQLICKSVLKLTRAYIELQMCVLGCISCTCTYIFVTLLFFQCC